MRIAFFSEAYDPQLNGVVTTQGKLIPFLRSRGHDVLLVVPRYKGNPRSAQIVEFKALPLPLYPEMPFILPHWKFHTQEIDRIANFKPDLVHLMIWGVYWPSLAKNGRDEAVAPSWLRTKPISFVTYLTMVSESLNPQHGFICAGSLTIASVPTSLHKIQRSFSQDTAFTISAYSSGRNTFP